MRFYSQVAKSTRANRDGQGHDLTPRISMQGLGALSEYEYSFSRGRPFVWRLTFVGKVLGYAGTIVKRLVKDESEWKQATRGTP